MNNPLKTAPFSKPILICLFLAIVTAFAYWPVRHHEFIRFDDEGYIYENYIVQQGLTQTGLAWSFVPGHAANWHPLTWLSYMLDVELFGVNPGAHHLVNLFFHIAAALLLFLLLRKMTGTFWRSAFVAALFALHPLHVESVAWIAERKDVLSAFFFFLTLWAYASYAAQRAKSHSPTFSRTRSLTFYFLALFFFALGLMSKPMLVTLPFVLLLLDFWPLKRISPDKPLWPLDLRLWTRLILEKLPFFALTIVSSVLTFVAQQNAGAMATLEQMVFSHRVKNALIAYVGYVGKLFWPAELTVLYPVKVWPLWLALGAALLLIFLFVFAFRMAKRFPYLLVGWLWYVGMLVPVIGLVHVGSAWMADRYTYLPMIGLFVILAWGGHTLLRWPQVRAAVAAVVLALLFLLTRQQVMLWRDSETLFLHTLRHTSENVLIQNNLAAEYIATGRIDEGIVLLQKALTSNPDLPNSLSNLGSALERQGKTDEAMALYQRSVRLNPRQPQAQNNLGYLLLLQRLFDAAIPHFQAAIKSQPDFPEPNYNLGNIFFITGDFVSAIQFYQEALRIRPAYVEARSNLAYTFLKLGQLDDALRHAEMAVHQNPDFAQAQNNLAEILLRRGQLDRAETHSRRAVTLHAASATFQNVLGRALAGQRKWPDAAAAFATAIALQPQFAEGHFNLANTLLAQNKVSEAKAHYSSALQAQPQYPEAEMQLAMLFLHEKNNAQAVSHLRTVAGQRPQWKEPINNLAWLLATSADPQLRDGKEALTWALQTVRVSPPEDFSALDTLAAAYAESGQFKEAIAQGEKALEIARRVGDTRSAAQITSRLQLYRQSQPYRE